MPAGVIAVSNDITHYLEAIAVEGLIEGMVSSAHRIETLLKYCPTDQGMYGPRRSPGERIVGLDDPERIERLARMVDFPGMLENNGCMGGSLALILERAQRGIDAGLDELTDEQRRCYMHASSYILLKSDGGDVCHAITLRQGMLRLEDSLTPDELLKVWWGKYPHGSWPRPGMLQSLTEVRAYACCMPYSDISYRRELTWRVWDELASLLRAGCIDTDDIVATRATTESLDHRDRANECLSYHRLVHEEGWDPDRAEAAVYFAMSLHQVIGETGSTWQMTCCVGVTLPRSYGISTGMYADASLRRQMTSGRTSASVMYGGLKRNARWPLLPGASWLL